MSPVCAICGTALALSTPCQQSHPEHCHACDQLNMRSGFDAREHRAPTESLVLSPRDVQALVAYQARVARLREEPDHA